MRLPRPQFTIRNLLALVAVCAVLLTLLRTPLGLVILAFMIALPGFLLERSRGGAGILGGALSSGLIAGAIWTVCTPYFFAYATSVGDAVYQFFHMLYFVVVAAFVCGGIWSAVLWVIVTPVTAVLRSSLSRQSCGPIRLYPPAQWAVRSDKTRGQ